MLLTNKVARVRKLHQQEQFCDSNAHFLIISNKRHVLNFELGSRRFCVLKVAENRKRQECFNKLLDYWADCANRIAVLEYLLSISLDNFNPERNQSSTSLTTTLEGENLDECHQFLLAFALQELTAKKSKGNNKGRSVSKYSMKKRKTTSASRKTLL